MFQYASFFSSESAVSSSRDPVFFQLLACLLELPITVTIKAGFHGAFVVKMSVFQQLTQSNHFIIHSPFSNIMQFPKFCDTKCQCVTALPMCFC